MVVIQNRFFEIIPNDQSDGEDFLGAKQNGRPSGLLTKALTKFYRKLKFGV